MCLDKLCARVARGTSIARWWRLPRHREPPLIVPSGVSSVPFRAGPLRLTILAMIGVLIVTASVVFVLLFLDVPKGWSPAPGFAPLIGDVYQRALSFPHHELTPDQYTYASMGTLLAAWTLWGAGLWLLARTKEPVERDRALLIVAVVAVTGRALLVLLPPVTSADLYRYALFGKMIAFHHLNPLVTPANVLTGDPMLTYTSWPSQSSLYGPTFLWIAAMVARLCGDQLIATGVAFKAVSAAADLAVCWALYRLARRTGSDDGLGALALYAWSPLALVESAVGAHVESLMMALALGGLLLAERKRVEGAFALFLMSAAVKYVSAIVGVLYFVHAVAAEPDARRRLACGVRLLATAAVVLAALYAPFWEGPDMLSLAVEHLAGGRNLAPSGDPVRSAPAVVIAGVALLAGASLVVVARGRLERVAEMSAAVILAYLLFVFQYKFAWYFLSPLALTAAGARTPTNRVLLMLSVTWGLLLMFTYAVLFNVAHPGM